MHPLWPDRRSQPAWRRSRPLGSIAGVEIKVATVRRATFLNVTAAGDEAGAAVAGEVVVHPLDEDEEAVIELDQVHEVDEDPEEPGGEPGKAQAPEVGDGLVAADGGEVALVEVAEGRQGA